MLAGMVPVTIWIAGRALSVEHISLSPHVLRMVGIVGARVSFEGGHQLLQELAGINVATKDVERHAECLGSQIVDDERQMTAPDAGGALPPTLYVGLDGTWGPYARQ